LKKLALLLFFLFHSSLFTLEAQDRHLIDSLENELKQFEAHKKEIGKNASQLMDSIKANLMYGIAIACWGDAYDTGMYYARQVLALSQQIGYTKGVGNAYNVMGLFTMEKKNYPGALDYFQRALKIRTDMGDKKGMAGIFSNLGIMSGNMGESEESLMWHLKSLKIREETGDKEGSYAASMKIGNCYAGLGKFPEAVTYYLNGLRISEELGNKGEISTSYLAIGSVYYSQRNYQEALKNYREELKFANESGSKYSITSAYFNIGRVYYKQGNDTGAISYMLASLKFLREAHKWIGYIADRHYNIAQVYLAMGNYPLALSYADSSLNEYQIDGNQLSKAMGYTEIGAIYEKQGRFQDAFDITTKGLSLAKEGRAMVLMKDAYAQLANINTEMGNYKAADEDYKEYNRTLDSVGSDEVQQKITVLEKNYSFEKREDSIRLEQEKTNIIKKAESNRKSIITRSAIVISILILISALLAINRQQIKRKKDAIIFEAEKQRMEGELANAKTILDEYIQSMAEKNKLLEEFKSDIEELKNVNDAGNIEKLEHLNKATILTDEDWNKFRLLFEQVYAGFFNRLREKLLDLTQAEIRLVCLTKLNIGTKQMAGILGVSFDTIKKSRHRLRRKLSLSEDDSIDDIVNSI